MAIYRSAGSGAGLRHTEPVVLESLPAVTTALTHNGHPGYVEVTSRVGLSAGAEVNLTSNTVNRSGLKVQYIDGLSVHL